MDLEALQTLVAVHRAAGITRAAEALHRSQSAISRRVSQLEQEIGAPLFERVSGGMVLSDVGRALLPFAEAALAAVEDACQAARDVVSKAAGPVGIALVGTLASTSLTPALRRFAERHPKVSLALQTATSREVSDLVRRADVALGLRYSEDLHPDLASETLFAERWVVACAPDHPRANRRCRALASLSGERWLAFRDTPGRSETSAARILRTLAEAGVSEASIVPIDSLTAQKRLVEAGFGMALVPASSIEEEKALGSLAVIAVAGLDVSIPVVLVTRRNGYLSGAARTLREELRRLAGSACGLPAG